MYFTFLWLSTVVHVVTICVHMYNTISCLDPKDEDCEDKPSTTRNNCYCFFFLSCIHSFLCVCVCFLYCVYEHFLTHIVAWKPYKSKALLSVFPANTPQRQCIARSLIHLITALPDTQVSDSAHTTNVSNRYNIFTSNFCSKLDSRGKQITKKQCTCTYYRQCIQQKVMVSCQHSSPGSHLSATQRGAYLYP